MAYNTGGYRNDPSALRGAAPGGYRRETDPVDFDSVFSRGLVIHPGRTLEQALAALAATARPSGLDVFKVDNNEFLVSGAPSGALIRGIHLADFGHATQSPGANARTAVAATTGPFAGLKAGDVVLPGRFPVGINDDLIFQGVDVPSDGVLNFLYYNPTAGALATGAVSVPCLVFNLTD